jgi:hypothetical protein
MEFGDDSNENGPLEIARPALPGRVFASYAVHENDLIVRTEDGLYRIGETK